MKKPRIIVYDTESTDLNANIGFLLCMSWKVLGEKKVHTIRVDDYDLFEKDCTDDYNVAKEAGEILRSADGWIGWYSKYHDAKFVQTRLLEHRLPPIPPMPASTHIDAWRIAKYQLKLNSNRLDTVSKFLGIKEKTPLEWKIWRRASAGYSDALNYVCRHCVADVECLEEAYYLLRALDPQHFNIALIGNEIDNSKKVNLNKVICPACGSIGKFRKEGHSYAQVTIKQRYTCKKCGKWLTGPPQRIKGVEAR